MIIDIHAHFGEWLSSSRRDTPERFIRVLDRFEIDASIVSSGRAILYDVTSGNEEVALLVERDPRIYGAVVINPHHHDASMADLDCYGANGRFVAVKFHPDYAGAPADSPLNITLIRRAAELGLPLLLHTWGDAEVESAAAVARMLPEMPIFLFHMGGNAWRLAITRAREHSNLNLEIVSTIPEPLRIRQAVEVLGAERVFFGTDMTLFTPAYALGLLDAAGLDEDDRLKILGLNAMRFFRVPGGRPKETR